MFTFLGYYYNSSVRSVSVCGGGVVPVNNKMVASGGCIKYQCKSLFAVIVNKDKTPTLFSNPADATVGLYHIPQCSDGVESQEIKRWDY